MSEIREQANLSGGRYKQNQKFEEMRRLADTLVQEKKEWNHKKQYLEKEDQVRKEKMEKDQVDRYLFKLHFNMLSQEATKKSPIGIISYRGH